jgi:hypothetical protein
MFQQEKSGVIGVTPGVSERHAALVTPEYVALIPGYPIPQGRLGQKLIGPLRSTPTGEDHTESATSFDGEPGLLDEKPGCTGAEGLLVRIDLDHV